MFCDKCKSWELLDGDEFCSWCGEQIVHVQIAPQPLRIYLDRDPTIASVFSRTIFKNVSAVPVNPSVNSAPPWFTSVRLSKSIVQPNEQLDVFLDVDTSQMGGVLIRDGELIFELGQRDTKERNKSSRIVVETEVWPAPELNVKPLTVFSGRPQSRIQLQANLLSPVTIEAIAFDKPYFAFDGQLPVSVDVGDISLPFQLNLPDQITDRTGSISFEFKVEGLDKPLVGTFDFEIKTPATLELITSAGGAECDLIPGSEEELSLVIRNRGEEDLTIDRIQVVPTAIQTNVVVKLEGEKLTVTPGEEVKIILKASAAASSEPGKYYFNLTLQSNDPNLEHNSHRVLVTVTDEECPEFIAVDFGTTDSTVAVFDGRGRTPLNLRLEQGNLDPKIYSNLFFMNYVEEKDPPYEWLIGTDAKILGPLRRERFVKAIKTKTGTNYKETIDFKEKAISLEIEAEEIIRFIMMDLVRLTKTALRKRPVRFILSVPTVFTLRRKEILEQTFSRAAEALSIKLQAVKTIDESLAAGLFYILLSGPQDERVNRKPNYTIMILDFGGGTTDITVLRVNQQPTADGPFEVNEVEVIGAWGDSNLGGEEITREIAKVLAAKFLKRSVDDEKDASEIRKLEDEAEAVKIAISGLQNLRREMGGALDFDQMLERASDSLRTNVAYLDLKRTSTNDELRQVLESYFDNDDSDSKLKVQSADFPGGQFVFIGEREVVDIYKHKLHTLRTEVDMLVSKIDRIAKSQSSAARSVNVDVLLLAGQSSQFPLVAEIFNDIADHIQFVKDPEGNLVLKECVSLGALYYSFILHGDIDVTLTGLNRIWTRIGRPKFRLGVGVQFQEIIPWGQEYPYESTSFSLTDADIQDGNRLVLRLFENLSMDDTLKLEPFKEFETIVDGNQARFPCILLVNQDGTFNARCQIGNNWRDMVEIKR